MFFKAVKKGKVSKKIKLSKESKPPFVCFNFISLVVPSTSGELFQRHGKIIFFPF